MIHAYRTKTGPLTVEDFDDDLPPGPLNLSKDAQHSQDRLLARIRARKQVKKYDDNEARDDHGRWTSGGGGEGVQLRPSTDRAFAGKQVDLKDPPSKLETGALGEKVAIAYLKSQGLSDAAPLNTKTTNFPVDMVGDHELYEVKTGLVSNGKSAQQWRATIGQPGKAETEWLKTASAEDKRAWNDQKAQAIMDRKSAAVKAFSEKLGVEVKGRTLTVLLNTNTKTADVFVFHGFHARISWTSEQAKAGYVGSYKYEE